MPFLIALVVAAILTPLAGRVGRAIGLVDRPDGANLKIHRGPIPILGGVAVAAVVLGTAAAFGWRMPAAVILGVIVALASGLVDDTKPLPSLLRVLLLLASGGLLALGGVRLGHPGVLSSVAVAMLVLACANGVNLLDGQDGLVGGLVAIAALGLALMLAREHVGHQVILSLALSGALVGFLIWNRPPARIFLGNSGAYALGAFIAIPLAALTQAAAWRGLLAGGICMGVFVVEISATIGRRAWARTALAKGDRQHSYDVVASMLRSRVKSTLLFWAVGILGAAFALAVSVLPLGIGVSLAAAAAMVLCVLGFRTWSPTGTQEVQDMQRETS